MGLSCPRLLGHLFPLPHLAEKCASHRPARGVRHRSHPRRCTHANGYSPQLVSDGKQAWKTCILQTGAIDYCNRATGFALYPDPRKTHLLEKLQYLQKNHLNLYSGDR